jgi:hypothetical protein
VSSVLTIGLTGLCTVLTEYIYMFRTIPRINSASFHSIIDEFVYVIERVFLCEVLGKKLLYVVYVSLGLQKIKLTG